MIRHVLALIVLCTVPVVAAELPAQWIEAAAAAYDSGNTEAAVAALNDVISFHPRSPQAVIAHRQLSVLCRQSGDVEQAADHNLRAWQLFKKHSRKAGFQARDVVHAAADARWILLEQERLAVQEALLDRHFRVGSGRRAVNQFEDECRELMSIDNDYAANAFRLTGEVRAAFADAVLRHAKNTVDPSQKQPDYLAVMPEYDRAASAFAMSYEQARGYSVKESMAKSSALRAFELTVRQGDLVIEYAQEQRRLAPSYRPDADARRAQLDYLVEEIAPLMAEGVNHHVRAVQMAASMPVQESAAGLQHRLDAPLRDVAKELADLGQGYCHEFYSSAVEAGSMSSMSFDPNVVVTAVDQMEMRYAAMEKSIETLSPVLMNWMNYAAPESRAIWNDWMIALYSERAMALKTAQLNLERCQAGVNKRSSVDAASFFRRLTKLHAEVVSTEYHTLVTWHDFVSKANIDHPQNKQLYERLGEVDPVHFGAVQNSSSAARPKP